MSYISNIRKHRPFKNQRSNIVAVIFLCFFSFLFRSTTTAAEIFPQNSNSEFIIDTFEDGNLDREPLWWQFGDIDVTISVHPSNAPSYLSKYSMKIKGNANEWYVGGVGTFCGADLSKFNAIKFYVKGKGEHSGTLLIEMYDDDNNNWELEPHPKIPSQPLFDDRFVYTKKVDWNGWKSVTIPLSHFSDVNPNIGDNIWNPNHKNSSGGLLQIQIILIAADKYIVPEISIDTIRIIRLNEIKEEPLRAPQFQDWI
jgi:hypothetical protein